MRSAFWAALYLAFGLSCMATFHSPVLLHTDAWAWAWLIGWPVLIGLFVMKWVLIVFAFCLLIGISIALWESRR